MHRWLWLLGILAGCDASSSSPPVPSPAHVDWAYPPAAAPGPEIAAGSPFGRGQVVAHARPVGIAGKPLPMLRLPTVWQVPGAGPARAVVYGTVQAGEVHAVELVDIDAGRVMWRDDKTCAGPVVGVTANAVVCADGKGTHAIALATGALEWETEMPYLAIDDDRVAIAASAGGGGGAIAVRAADSGDELGRVVLPAGVASASIVATCGVREVLAANPDGKLARIVDGKVTWTAPTAQLEKVDACGGETILVTERGGHVVAVARATGKITGEVMGVRGMWPARDGADGALEIATAEATLRYARDLAAPPTGTNLGAFGDQGGEPIASRGVGVRLVRLTARTAALVDAAGIRAYVPFGELGGALGDTAVIAASWQGEAGETVHRRLLPPATAPRPDGPPILARHAPIELAAELRDLPPLGAESDGTVLVPGREPDVDARVVAEVALDPRDPRIAYAVATARDRSDLEANPAATIARADLAAKTWTWLRTDGCGPGTPAPIAFTRDAIVCAAHSPRSATLRATARATGKPVWELAVGLRPDRDDGAVDSVIGGGDVVVAVTGDRGTVVDATSGGVLGAIASDDGMAPRAAIVVRGPDTWLASVERGAIVVRVPRAAMLPIAAISVRGTVRALAPIDDGRILVDLEDGDAYVLDLVTREAVAVPSPNATAIAADHEWVTTTTPGGPLYGPYPAAGVPPRAAAPAPLGRPIPHPAPMVVDTMTTPPTLPTPIPPPPRIGTAWQLSLFAPGGGLVARNDYALPTTLDAIGPAARAPRAPFAVRSWTDPTDAASVITVLDARTGDPTARTATRQVGAVFSTVIDGKAVLGMAAAGPLRIVAF